MNNSNRQSKVHRSKQSGEIPIGHLLLIGMIAIPLVITLVIFRIEIFTWLIDKWVELVTTPGPSGFSSFTLLQLKTPFV
ncbi:MAG: hypothetical protein ACI909_002529 [Planctomycetota bacterium]|jgi:hypothetical protein